jgi:hypothetical protein
MSGTPHLDLTRRHAAPRQVPPGAKPGTARDMGRITGTAGAAPIQGRPPRGAAPPAGLPTTIRPALAGARTDTGTGAGTGTAISGRPAGAYQTTTGGGGGDSGMDQATGATAGATSAA